MTKKWSNINLPGALHFITGNVLHRIPIFRQDKCCEAFLGVCSTLLSDWPCKLISYVLMPDHFHLIVNPRDGDIKGFTGALKSLAAGSIIEIAEEKLFQRRDGLWSSWMIWQKIDYIHANPTKARLVSSARDYRWSSFRDFYFNSGEPLPVDHDWWWPEDSEKLAKVMEETGLRFQNRKKE
jgi:putative transposase